MFIKWRRAEEKDMRRIFTLGYDQWGEGLTLEEHIDKCMHSPKYENGEWFVIEDTDNEEVVSALIAYDLHKEGEPVVKGLGTFATEPFTRRKGYGSKLIDQTLQGLEAEDCYHFFLFSDIDTEFYKQFGFKELPEKFQKYDDTVLMYYGMNDELDLETFTIPEYF